MPGISIHVVDVARGVLAAGMRVALHRVGAGGEAIALVTGAIGADGLLNDAQLAGRFAAGAYRATFHVADFYRAQSVALPRLPFLDVVTFDFGITDPEQHYHLPFKCTPWGYSCFRGGA